jgi:hypothetical protein
MNGYLELKTTGESFYHDEVLQVMLFDEKGNRVINQYCNPNVELDWKEVNEKLLINEDMVSGNLPFSEYADELEESLYKFDCIYTNNEVQTKGWLQEYEIEYNCEWKTTSMSEFLANKRG